VRSLRGRFVSIAVTSYSWLGELPNSFGDTGTDANAVETVLRSHPTYPIGYPEFDRVLQTKALAAIESHPGFYVKLVVRRLLESTVLPTPTRSANASRIASLAAWAEPLLFVIAVITAVLMCLRQPASRWAVALLSATAVTTVVPYLVIHLEARYLVATAFVYLILAAVGGTLALDKLAGRLAVHRVAPTPRVQRASTWSDRR
jgi:hypothetical protein